MTADRLAETWLEALRSAPIAAALEVIYAQAATAIAARGPVCWASGRCCHFEQAGHRLYVTGLEAAYCLSRLGGTEWQAAAARAATGRPAVEITIAGRTVSANPAPSPAGFAADLASAASRGGCPFQLAHLCGVHTVKPLGCRIYFCDASAQSWQHELSERLLTGIRTLHDQHQIEYRYGEWRSMLAMFPSV